MWWIAACLGALLWLLVVRIKLKEKERQSRREEQGGGHDDAQRRQTFIRDGFTPVASVYLTHEPEVAAVVLMFARFDWDDKPPEVHMEVLPLRVTQGTWPELIDECHWIRRAMDGKAAFEPPQAHWERLTGLEPWLDQLSCFAELLPAVRAQAATLEDYRLYAWARREGEGATVEVVHSPALLNATRLQKQSNVI